MNELSRREFFQYLTLRAVHRAQKSIAKATRAFDAATPETAGRAPCARCYARFDPDEHEILCSACREYEEKQRALFEQITPR